MINYIYGDVMDRITFILIAIAYYILTIVSVIVILNVLNNKEKKKLKKEIEKLETEKNMVISASMLSELNKVEALVNNDEMKEKLNDWKSRFNDIKEVEMPKITDTINEIEELFEEKNFKDLKGLVLKADFDLNTLKTKASFLLDEIKDVTLSEERNRETITKLKAEYRDLTAQKDGSIHVSDNGICVILINRLELTLRLQHQTGGDLTASDGGHQLFQLRNLPDVGTLINQTAHMNRKPAAIHIVGLFTKQVE